MDSLGGPRAAFAAIAARRVGDATPLIDEALGTAGAAGNDPRLAAFDRFAHGADLGSATFGPDALVPFQLATTGAIGAGYEAFKKLTGQRGLRKLAAITGNEDFTAASESTSPPSAANARALIEGMFEGAVFNRGIVPPPPDLRLPQHPASSAVERAAQRFKR